MLKLMIIDDEKLIREGLVTYIDWNSLGIEVCMTCANAVEALKGLDESHPDIILSDIRMPKMDGIELLKAIKFSKYQCEVIFISAYRDFDYAKEAVKYGAFDYLLKPIEEDVLTESVSRCVTCINEKKGAIDRKLSKEEIQKDLMVYLLSSTTIEDSWTDISEKIGISVDSGATLAIVRTDDSELKNMSENYAWEICCSMDIFSEKHVFVTIKLDEHEVLIFAFGGRQPAHTCTLKDLNGKITKLGLSVMIGISSSEKGYDPKLLYSEASWGMLCFELGYCGKVSSYKELSLYVDKFTKIVPKAADFLSEIKSADNNKLCQLLNNFFLSLVGGKHLYDTDLVKLEVSKLFDGIFQSLSNYPIWTELENLGSREGFRKNISSQKSIFSIYTVSRNILNNILSLINSQQFNSTSRIINSAINIIQKDLASDISLENVAKQLFVNPNYLSRIFSNEMSQSFSHFRAKMRVERAKEFLQFSKYKIYEIASMVGYSNVAHFTKVFCSFEGVSPSEFRDKNASIK